MTSWLNLRLPFLQERAPRVLLRPGRFINPGRGRPPSSKPVMSVNGPAHICSHKHCVEDCRTCRALPAARLYIENVRPGRSCLHLGFRSGTATASNCGPADSNAAGQQCGKGFGHITWDGQELTSGRGCCHRIAFALASLNRPPRPW